MKLMVILIVIVALETILKNLVTRLENIEIIAQVDTALLRLARILGRVQVIY